MKWGACSSIAASCLLSIPCFSFSTMNASILLAWFLNCSDLMMSTQTTKACNDLLVKVYPISSLASSDYYNLLRFCLIRRSLSISSSLRISEKILNNLHIKRASTNVKVEALFVLRNYYCKPLTCSFACIRASCTLFLSPTHKILLQQLYSKAYASILGDMLVDLQKRVVV